MRSTSPVTAYLAPCLRIRRLCVRGDGDEAGDFELLGWKDVEGKDMRKGVGLGGEVVEDWVIGQAEVAAEEVDEDVDVLFRTYCGGHEHRK